MIPIVDVELELLKEKCSVEEKKLLVCLNTIEVQNMMP